MKIVVCHSRKGGVGKTTLAYELAWLLEAPLVDLDWEGGTASTRWGYRWKDHESSPIIDAIERGRPPRPLAGRRTRRPDLVPNHPTFEQFQPAADEMADALRKWAGEWATDFMVVDTHPGATSATNGALQVADAVVVPVVLAVLDIAGTAATVDELTGYPLILIPNKVPPAPPKSMRDELRRALAPHPSAQVGPSVPRADAVMARRRRPAMSSDEPPFKALRGVVTGLERVAGFVREYVDDAN